MMGLVLILVAGIQIRKLWPWAPIFIVGYSIVATSLEMLMLKGDGRPMIPFVLALLIGLAFTTVAFFLVWIVARAVRQFKEKRRADAGDDGE